MVWDARLAKPGRSKVSLSQPVLYLTMGFQVPRHQVYIVLRAADPLADYLPVSETLYRHLEAVGLQKVAPYHTTGLTHHTHHLAHIGVNPNMVKQLCQDAECPLYPGCSH